MKPRPLSKSDFLKALETYRIVAAFRKVPPHKIAPTVHALYDGGIRLLEITFDQSSATCIQDTTESIEIAADLGLPGLMVGAGTVLTAEQAEAAYRAGAGYILAPNTNAQVMQVANAHQMASLPGAFTPSEIVEAYSMGAACVKVFPADNVGPAYIKAVRSPISHIPMLAMGGVNAENLKAYLAAGVTGVGVGSNIVNLEKINAGDFESITKQAKAYTSQL